MYARPEWQLLWRGNGQVYIVQDDHAAYFHQLRDAGLSLEEMAEKLLDDKNLWGVDLAKLPSFRVAVTSYLQSFITDGVMNTLKEFQ